MASQLLGIKTRFTDDLGSPLVGGQVYTYFAGTSTNQDSYSDAALTVPNTNPVILDDTGSADIFLKGAYRIRVFDKSGRFIEEQDNVTQAASQGDATELSNKVTTLESGLSAVKLDTGITATAKFGGVERSQAEKNSDTVSVKDFGAVGDGVVNDTDAFQKAHDYVKSKGGGIVHIPAGTYKVQGVVFERGVMWRGDGTDNTIIKPPATPVADLGLFTVVDNEPSSLTGIGFSDMKIQGDATASGYRPHGATVHGIDFGTNTADAEINQCYFDNLFITLCKTGLNLVRSVRYAPIRGCRFWRNNLGVWIGNEHPVFTDNDFRYNLVGVDGIAQDMDMTNTRFSYNRVGCQIEMSRSALVNCKFWQNEIAGITNLLEYNVLTGCLFRGAGTFWETVNGSTNESIMIGLSSRGTNVSNSLFYGGNGLEKPMIDFISNNDQHSFSISSNMFIVDAGHVISKSGLGSILSIDIENNNFLVSSVGDSNGAMILRIKDQTGAVRNIKYSSNSIRNTITQTHDFIVSEQSSSSGHIITNNYFYSTSGMCGGIAIKDLTNSIVSGNVFNVYSLPGIGFFNKIDLTNKITGLIVKDNVGFKTENSGTASIPVGSSSVVVEHGLDYPPHVSGLSITPYIGLGGASNYLVSDYTDSTFKITINKPAEVNSANFIWNISANIHS